MQITVRLRRKAGVDALGKTVFNILVDDFCEEVVYIL